ncbi:hypothetical protein ECG_00728 [Echinococcus granulosus]|uniref:Secreted protein n=1 Tax=Echinococcus granulosus TaxID=6210 RepID=A0A068W9S6_ECHGR|nr:hypothetical protein ECG_00728 [Echinococcus granulosus]CDS16410.1 hypothetical protein EgrG_000883400 [Echinococcus granulosus]
MTLPKLSAFKRNSNKSSAFWDNSNPLGTFACSSAPTNGIYSMWVTSTGLWVVLALPISSDFNSYNRSPLRRSPPALTAICWLMFRGTYDR